MTRDHFLDEDRFDPGNPFDGLPRHGLGQEPDEITGVPGLHGDTDFAIGLEAANAGTMAGARINHDERSTPRINLDALRGNDPHKRVIDRLLEISAVDDQFSGVTQYMWRGLCYVVTILVAALAHDIEKQHAALPGIHHVFDGRSDQTRHRAARRRCIVHRHVSTLTRCEVQSMSPAAPDVDLGQRPKLVSAEPPPHGRRVSRRPSIPKPMTG
jgi:hypothetical protein